MPTPVLGIAEARAELPALVRRLRDDPTSSRIPIGSHRKPTAYLVSAARIDKSPGDGSVLDQLRRMARPIRTLAAIRGIERVQVFGSVARGEEQPDSDIDLLVSSGPGTSTIDLAAFALDIEALTERAVDILDERTLRPERHDEILSDAVLL